TEVQELLRFAGVGGERSGQCFVLRFRFDLQEAAASGKIAKKESFCLFDYTGRNALDGTCRALWVAKSDLRGICKSGMCKKRAEMEKI
ncbi:MAG: hypothetical protein K2N94_06780, partial [Lachnospiraceae bacterium]|nr:hypothetical protein [Lachnospiraceae bacterium]